MIIQTINGQRVLTPDENMWLYNEGQKVLSDKVYLGIKADESEWTEVTQEQKEFLEYRWKSETEGSFDTDVSEKILLKAQAYDIITGGAE